MEYKGIEYEIRLRPGNEEWSWTIKPTASTSYSGETRGSRQFAEIAAKQAIERWLKRNQKRTKTKSKKITAIRLFRESLRCEPGALICKWHPTRPVNQARCCDAAVQPLVF